MTYKFDVIGAYLAGQKDHPQSVIARYFRNVTRWEPCPLADAWFFESPETPRNLPEFMRACPEFVFS